MVLSALYSLFSWDCDLASSVTMTVIIRTVLFKEGVTRYMTFSIPLFSCGLHNNSQVSVYSRYFRSLCYLHGVFDLLDFSLHCSQILSQMTISKMPLCPKL